MKDEVRSTRTGCGNQTLHRMPDLRAAGGFPSPPSSDRRESMNRAPPEQTMCAPELACATQLQPQHVDDKTTLKAGTETRPPPAAVAPQPLPASGPDQTASQEHAPDSHTSEDNAGVTQADVLIIRTPESTWIGPVNWQGLPHGIGSHHVPPSA
jgi:hypothetical protein